jgi:hypothetical protein
MAKLRERKAGAQSAHSGRECEVTLEDFSVVEGQPEPEGKMAFTLTIKDQGAGVLRYHFSLEQMQDLFEQYEALIGTARR